MSVTKAFYIAAAVVIPLTLLPQWSRSSANPYFSVILFFVLFAGMIGQMALAGAARRDTGTGRRGSDRGSGCQ